MLFCLNLQKMPGGNRLEVPDLIKEILTGSEKQVGWIFLQRDPANSLVSLFSGANRTELG